MKAEIKKFEDEYNLVTVVISLSSAPHSVTITFEYDGEPADVGEAAEKAAQAFVEHYHQLPGDDQPEIEDRRIMVSVGELKIGMSGCMPYLGLHVDLDMQYWVGENFPVHLNIPRQSGTLEIVRTEEGLQVYGVDPETVRVSDMQKFDRPVSVHP